MTWNQDVFFARRDRLNFKKTPHCIYFYYVAPPRQGETALHIRQYYHPGGPQEIRYEEVEELIRKLARNARKPETDAAGNPIQNPRPRPGHPNLDGIEWTRKSYIVFVRDGGVEFDPRLPIEFDYDNEGKTNHSFFDGWCREVDLSDNRNGSDKCSVLCFINHFKRDQNSDVERGQEIYMPFRLHYKGVGMIRHPDSGGTNMGPAVGPP